MTIHRPEESNLDPKKVKMVYQLLQDTISLKNKIIITHNLDLAYKLGYDILYIENKKIKFHGENNRFRISNQIGIKIIRLI